MVFNIKTNHREEKDIPKVRTGSERSGLKSSSFPPPRTPLANFVAYQVRSSSPRLVSDHWWHHLACLWLPPCTYQNSWVTSGIHFHQFRACYGQPLCTHPVPMFTTILWDWREIPAHQSWPYLSMWLAKNNDLRVAVHDVSLLCSLGWTQICVPLLRLTGFPLEKLGHANFSYILGT